MLKLERLAQGIIGPARDPLAPDTRAHTLLVGLLAWAGLGASGLASVSYGPERAYLALGAHPELGVFLALATLLTVWVLSLAYRQVVELFPSGGGNYKIVSKLLGPRLGLVAGCALLVDYVLTIAVCLASGTDALFSLLPVEWQSHKLVVEVGLVLLLILLNLRGIADSIRLLLPLTLGFVLVHVGLIVYGVASKAGDLTGTLVRSSADTVALSGDIGWPLLVALFLRAYSLGGSTYAGSEAIANNVNLLAEPRIKTGRTALLSVGFSLAFMAGGMILLYSLWGAQPTYGQTLNAVVFKAVIEQLGIAPGASHGLLLLTLALEGAIVFVAANSILIFAPSLLGRMAADSWLPHRFCNLSNRLVKQNGVVFVGACALLILLLSRGSLGLLVVLYSINVFLSLALAKAGLCRHWWQHRREGPWLGRMLVSVTGFCVASGILLVTLTEKFFEGGWATLCLTLLVIGGCALVRHHYAKVETLRLQMDTEFTLPAQVLATVTRIEPTPDAPTAVILATEHWGAAIHTLLWVQRLFPNRFANVVFVGIVKVEGHVWGRIDGVQRRKTRLDESMDQLEAFCAQAGISATRRIGYGTDPVAELQKLLGEATRHYPGCVCFSNKLILQDSWGFSEWLHNQTPLLLQRRLHLDGIPLVILPLRLSGSEHKSVMA
ncbi:MULTISPECIES: APC family permease [Pseudomonas]|uniref:APC family permease n=1 Tax=Pseudomonas gingeri TaxID=117681 RepID=A0A7Y8BPH1_9PSED|nr:MULTISPECIES: amino acid permease [Pseudomonas]MPQ67871.1 amino acid permease [Pseudomonas sp. MWU12-2323]NWB83505.1 APC family permease [Pseudomonas gingeri]